MPERSGWVSRLRAVLPRDGEGQRSLRPLPRDAGLGPWDFVHVSVPDGQWDAGQTAAVVQRSSVRSWAAKAWPKRGRESAASRVGRWPRSEVLHWLFPEIMVKKLGLQDVCVLDPERVFSPWPGETPAAGAGGRDPAAWQQQRWGHPTHTGAPWLGTPVPSPEPAPGLLFVPCAVGPCGSATENRGGTEPRSADLHRSGASARLPGGAAGGNEGPLQLTQSSSKGLNRL